MSHPTFKPEDIAWPSNTYFYSDSSTDTDQAINLEPYQTTVIITLSDGTGTATALLNLPPVSKCKGSVFTIVGKDVAGGITIRTNSGASFDDSPDWTDIAINADLDTAVLYSNGERWLVLEDRYT